MRRRHIALGLVCMLVLALAGSGWLGYRAWQDWIRTSGIGQLQWQGPGLGPGGVTLDRFELVRDQAGGRVGVSGRGLNLDWSWHWRGPRLRGLALEQLHVDWQQSATADADTPTTGAAGLPLWLPRTLRIDRFSADLPCPAGACRVAGSVSVQRRQASELLPLKARIELAHGDVQGLLVVDLRGSLQAPVDLEADLTLEGSVGQLAQGGWRLRDLAAKLTMTGTLKDNDFALTLARDSVVRAARVSGPEADGSLALLGLRGELGGLRLSGVHDPDAPGLRDLSGEGPVSLAVEQLQHALLRPRSWQFRGEVAGNPEQLTLAGALRAGAGPELMLQLSQRFGGLLRASADTRISAGEHGEDLASLLVPWPEGLALSSGHGDLQVSLLRPAGDTVELEGHLVFDELAGVYDRMAWSGLNGALGGHFYGTSLRLGTEGLTLAQLNAGIPLGPVRVGGTYEAELSRPLAGELDLGQGRADFLGGEVWVEPGTWSLADRPLRVPLQLEGLELERLMALYPAEDLAGSGILDGEVPLLIDSGGVRVEQGRVRAQAPGGTLTLPVERIRAMAGDNPTLDLVARAVDNFHYSVLDSSIEYAEDGTLTLGLQLHGRNPELQQGRPIRLNITLEEDIPALLTSLQLSGRVNEAVTERVRELVRQRETDDPDTE